MSGAPSATSSSTSIRRATSLSSEEIDLWELCYYAGVTIDPQVFRILVDLLHMDVHPKAVLDVLKSIAPYSKYAIKEEDIKENSSITTNEKSTSQRYSFQKSSNHEAISSGSNKSARSTVRNSSVERRNASSKVSRNSKSAQSLNKQPSDKSRSSTTAKKK